MSCESDGASNSSNIDKNLNAKCKLCAKFIGKYAVKCGTTNCDTVIHNKCFDLISRVVEIDPIDFKCRHCPSPPRDSQQTQNSEIIILRKEVECLTREKELISKYVTELEFTNQILKTDKIADLNKLNKEPEYAGVSAGLSYAAAVTKKKTNINKEPMPLFPLLVRSKNAIANVEVEKAVKSKVNPGADRIGVISTKLVKNGLLINCGDVDSINKLKNDLNLSLSSNFDVFEPKKFNPRVLVYGIDVDTAESDDLESIIRRDNEFDPTSGELKLVTEFKYKNMYNAIVECSPAAFKAIMERGYMWVSWSRCRIREHFSLRKCFKCWKFGHEKKDCKSKVPICPECGEHHEKKDCNSQLKCCTNCNLFNKKTKSNLSTDHHVNSPNCSYVLNTLKSFKSRINYG